MFSRKFLIVAGAVVIVFSGCGVFQYSDPCHCVSPPRRIFYRNDAKNETQFHRYFRHEDTISVHDIASWQERFAPAYLRWKSDVDRFTLRRTGTPEDSIYVLKGRLVFVRQMLDCDFHMEVIPFEHDDGHVVVCEVSPENCGEQRRIRTELIRRGFRLDSHFRQGIPVAITGLGFNDGQHEGKKGRRRETQWELHPVLKMDFLDGKSEQRM